MARDEIRRVLYNRTITDATGETVWASECLDAEEMALDEELHSRWAR